MNFLSNLMKKSTTFIIGMLLNFSALPTLLWVEDESDTATAYKATANSGYDARKALVTQGKRVFFSTQLHLDLFGFRRCLLPEVSLKIDLTRNREDFFLMADKSKLGDKLKLNLLNLKLHLKTTTVSAAITNHYENMLRDRSALYPVIYSQISFNSLGVNMKSHDFHSIYQGLKPSTIMCCFVNNKQCVLFNFPGFR